MKLRGFRLAAVLAACVCAALAGALATRAAAQQTYRNVVNVRFRAVSNGPQSALIVDVKDSSDTAAVRRAVQERYTAYSNARDPIVKRELDFLMRRGRLRPGTQLDIADVVLVRRNERLAAPKPPPPGRAPNELTFTIPTSGDGGWSAQAATELAALRDALYPELKTVLGAPGWSGNVTLLNKDPRLGKVDSVIGALLVVDSTSGNVEIWFPSFSAFQTRFLALAQVMAQAFHAKQRIAWDAWEQGMGRAAALVCARDLQTIFTENGQAVTAAANALSFYYTPFYDLLNQPALGNNTFTPPTKSNQDLNQSTLTTLAGMLVPRLQMSSTAWLKCFIENSGFFQNFNAAYYAAFAQDATIANDTNRLRALAAAAVPTVEAMPFDDWFERQYVLDTSVTPGRKLYAYTQPTFPSGAQGDDSGAAIFLVYYQTTTTGDELDRSGTANLVYWDYSFINRLFLPSFDIATITDGFGSVAPFFTNIGGNPPDQMRVAIDIPINKEYVRIYFPTGETGTEAAPNDFAGVVVGADTGNLSVVYRDGGGTIATTVKQGVFGAIGAQGAVPNGFSRTTLTFTTPQSQTYAFQRNTAFNNTFFIAPIFVLAVPPPAATLSYQFAAGPQLITLPFRPFTNDLARVLGTDPNATLLAQWRQDLTGDNKYLYYPTLPPYQPGYGLWSNFAALVDATNMKGERTDNEQAISIAVPFGWTQIGPPYPDTDMNLDSDIEVQYLGDTPVTFSAAVTNGWIAPGLFGYTPDTGYHDITNPNDTTLPAKTLQGWHGYWVRVLVTEGVTLTYLNPNLSRESRAARRSGSKGGNGTRAAAPSRERDSWRVPLFVRDTAGRTATATFGQSPRGNASYVPTLSVASPPPLARGTPLLGIRFPHTDWDAGTGGSGGDFVTDIRRSATRAEWDVVVTVPQAEQTYTLTWGNTAALPRGTRLTLVDTETGTRRLMNSASSFTFRVGTGQVERRFQIVAEPRTANRLLITNVVANAPLVGGRAASTVSISYELSAPAETQIAIRQAGRLVRRLSSGRAAASGLNQTVWDTKDEQGRILPAGAYTLEITARTPEGEQTRSIVPLLLTR